MSLNRRAGPIAYAVLFVLYYAVIYLYFEQSQTRTIYGDDLYMFEEQWGYTRLADILAAGKIAYKFRPLYGLVSWAEVHGFGRHPEYFYLFNVGMQALIALVFTATVQLFLQRIWLAALVGLLAGLTRFAFYNIIQLMCGGPLEALAMLLFLATLYHLVRHLTATSGQPQYRHLLLALLFANLAIYAHERYLVLFPAIMLFCFFHPGKILLTLRQKGLVCAIAGASVFANYAVKEYVYHYRFLVGSGVSSLTADFSAGKQMGFAGDALLSIIQFNSGAGYLIGYGFNDTSDLHKAIAITAVALLAVLLVWSIARPRSDAEVSVSSRKLILCLLVIFLATLAPAVSTLNLEQRWLQAPLSVFLLIVVVAISRTAAARKTLHTALFTVFLLLFAVSDYIYRLRLDHFFWMKGMEWVATCYRMAAEDGRTGKQIDTIFYLQPNRDGARETQVGWLLSAGDFYRFYQGKKKEIVFIDSNKFRNPDQLSYMMHFDTATQQVLTFTDGLYILTDSVLRDRRRYLDTSAHKEKAPVSATP